MPFNSISQKNVNKNIELETAMNTFCFIIGDVLHNKFCFYPSLAFFCCVGLQCQFSVTHIYFKMLYAHLNFLFFYLF